MSIVVHNREVKQGIIPPITNVLNPHLILEKDLPIDDIISLIARHFNCAMFYRSNLVSTKDLHFFLLGDMHSSELVRNVNTFMVKLFAKDGDLVSAEGASILSSEMIHLEQISRRLHRDSWDLQNWGVAYAKVCGAIWYTGKCSLEMYQINQETQSKEISQKVDLLNETVEGLFAYMKESQILKDNKLIEQYEEIDKLDLNLLVLNKKIRLFSNITRIAAQIMRNTLFESRQKEFSKDIFDREFAMNACFYLAGISHIFKGDEFEHQIEEVLDQTQRGFLAISTEEPSFELLFSPNVEDVQKGLELSIHSERFQKPEEFDYDKPMANYQFCFIHSLFEKHALMLNQQQNKLFPEISAPIA